MGKYLNDLKYQSISKKEVYRKQLAVNNYLESVLKILRKEQHNATFDDETEYLEVFAQDAADSENFKIITK